MQSTTDEVLIGRIANGDRLAMQVLFARYHVRVFRFVVRLVRDEATAEDVISEVFLDVWRQAGRFEGRATVSTWLLAIARFKAISALRRRHDEELDEEAAAAIEDPSDDPATALEKKDKSAMLRKCLGGLSTEHREVTEITSRIFPFRPNLDLHPTPGHFNTAATSSAHSLKIHSCRIVRNSADAAHPRRREGSIKELICCDCSEP